jgi:hypothetical protein
MKIRNLKFKIYPTLLFVVCYLLFAAQSANAAGVSLGIYPPILQVETLPPAKAEAPLTIINFNDSDVSLKISLKPFFPAESEDGQIDYFNNQDFFKDDPLLFQRVKIFDGNQPIDKLVLAPKQKKDLTVKIEIPDNETLSDYYFSIIFASDSGPEQDANQSAAVGGIAANVLLSVGSKDLAKGNIEEYSVPFLVDSGPVPFTVKIKNKGSHFFAPKGEIIIKNLFGQPVGRVNLLPVNILAQSKRFLPDTLQIPTATGSAVAKYQSLYTKFPHPIAFWYEKFLLGPYSANLTIALSENGPLFKRTVYFLAFPVKLLLGIIIVILIIIFIARRVRDLDKNSKK